MTDRATKLPNPQTLCFTQHRYASWKHAVVDTESTRYGIPITKEVYHKIRGVLPFFEDSSKGRCRIRTTLASNNSTKGSTYLVPREVRACK
jgi:hypothetical protein